LRTLPAVQSVKARRTKHARLTQQEKQWILGHGCEGQKREEQKHETVAGMTGASANKP